MWLTFWVKYLPSSVRTNSFSFKVTQGGAPELANKMANKIDPVSGFLGCPAILEKIFLFLPYIEIDRCRLVSKQWKHYLEETFLETKSVIDTLENFGYGDLWMDPKRKICLVYQGSKINLECLLYVNKSKRRVLWAWKYQFPYDHWSQAMFISVSTWMGDFSSIVWVLLLTLKIS